VSISEPIPDNLPMHQCLSPLCVLLLSLVNSPKTLQMTGVPVDDWKLQLQANQIFNVSSRITRAMVEIALQSMQMQTCVSVLKLEQAIETRCYSEFSTNLMQSGRSTLQLCSIMSKRFNSSNLLITFSSNALLEKQHHEN
jgi:Sec63 Brl domain